MEVLKLKTGQRVSGGTETARNRVVENENLCLQAIKVRRRMRCIAGGSREEPEFKMATTA